MITEFVKVTPQDTEILSKAGEIIRCGGLVAFPTETVYGLGGNAYDPKASEKIFAAKGRPGDNPLIVHVAAPEEAEAFAYTNETYYALCRRFAPGPLTVILPKKDSIPLSVTGGLDTVAVRCPSHPVARALIKAAGVPIAAPSANISGAPSPTSASHVLHDMDGRIEMILDGGSCDIGVESTVIKIEDGVCTVLRPGDIIPRELCSVIPDVRVAAAVTDPTAAGDKPQSPGMKYKHYAPASRLVLLDGDREKFKEYVNSQKEKCAVLAYTEEIGDFTRAFVMDIGESKDAHTQMKRLFSLLRDTDGLCADVIYAHLPPKTDEFLALYNRIIRAAGCEVIKL